MNAWFPRVTIHSLFIVISVLTYVLTTRVEHERRPPSIAIAWVLGMIVAAGAAVLIGLPTFRLRGHYFALSMLAYPLAILYFLQYLGFQEMSLQRIYAQVLAGNSASCRVLEKLGMQNEGIRRRHILFRLRRRREKSHPRNILRKH